jgi:hypothetical protein
MLARERDAERRVGVRRADVGRQAAALAAEDEEVVLAEADRRVGARRARGEAEEPPGPARGEERVPARVAAPADVRPVVEARAAQVPVVDGEAERIDQMQRLVGRHAEAPDRPRVLRDLGRNQDDVHQRARAAIGTRVRPTARTAPAPGAHSAGRMSA